MIHECATDPLTSPGVGLLLLSCPSHNVLPLAGACLCPLCHCGQVVSRTGVEIAPSPHRCFRTANHCAQSVNSSPAEPVLSRSSRQRLGHLQSHFDRGWHVCQAVFPELQSAAACRRVERRDGAHKALPRLQSACSWLVME